MNRKFGLTDDDRMYRFAARMEGAALERSLPEAVRWMHHQRSISLTRMEKAMVPP
jgi:hypothetical protein